MALLFIKRSLTLLAFFITDYVYCYQVFEIYEALSDPSLTAMNDVVRGAVNLCSGCYICVGIFGYIAFAADETRVNGNILTAFPPTFLVETIKLGFVLSVAVSFPMVIFPCRTSIHSLIFKKGANLGQNELASNFIPSERSVKYCTS